MLQWFANARPSQQSNTTMFQLCANLGIPTLSTLATEFWEKLILSTCSSTISPTSSSWKASARIKTASQPASASKPASANEPIGVMQRINADASTPCSLKAHRKSTCRRARNGRLAVGNPALTLYQPLATRIWHGHKQNRGRMEPEFVQNQPIDRTLTRPLTAHQPPIDRPLTAHRPPINQQADANRSAKGTKPSPET